ncbi:PREDICTED: carbonic anhydrase 1-like [Polistes canadensis]|uniref:carbonic anhydrase 1-like n=1 Tax=Polistes canadensis TaxID=91411 RepID=UPI000718FF4C|nr:PREDICTED: carbonic anhydrase 1-like [Polistes canadensis]
MEDKTEINLDRENVKLIQRLGNVEGKLESPIDLDISKMTPINLPPLKWFYYDVAPRKLKITNTGDTAVLSAKWQMEQLPYITAGPLNGNYVFSQMHFHWGRTEIHGSEHRADNAK